MADPPARPYRWCPDTPTFTGNGSGETLLIDGLARGWGVWAGCCDCDFAIRLYAREVLERFWKWIDMPYAKAFSTTVCRQCGSKRLKLSQFNGGETLPAPSYMAHEAGEQYADMEQRIRRWVAERNDPQPNDAQSPG